MDYLILDTNIYISLLLKRTESVTGTCLSCLRRLLDQSRIKIILPQIVKHEFLHNIEPQFQRSKEILKNTINQIDKIILPHNISDKLRFETKTKLGQILATFNGLNVEEQVEPVLKIMDHENTIFVKTTDELILSTYKRVIDKFAPAHNPNKRSEADCLIVEAMLSCLSRAPDIENAFFITDNKTDFSDPLKPNEIHPDLKSVFNKFSISYSLYLARILKEELGQNIDDKDIEYEEELVMWPVLNPHNPRSVFSATTIFS